jgi:hypothetical protein
MASSEPLVVLSRRALNRATLARQHLLERVRSPALLELDHLVGMQAQVPLTPYFGLWSRLEHFDAEELSTDLRERRAVRIALMRSTIHLVSARDCLRLRPLLQPVLERGMQGTFGRRLEGLDLEEVARAGSAEVEAAPLSFGELGARLAPRWPGRDPEALANAVRARVPLVQVTPRGLWRGSGLARHTTARHWLGDQTLPPAEAEELVLRYLAAFGPATVMDLQMWCGLTRMGPLVGRLREGLVTFADDQGRELFDLPEAPRPDADTPAPIRFLPEFDNLLLSYVDRSRVIDDAHRARVYTDHGVRGTVLLDGFVAGTWRTTSAKRSTALSVEMFGTVPRAARSELRREAEALLTFASAEGWARELIISSGS